MNGLLLVNKPSGISSYDVIRRLKRILLLDPSLPLNHRGKKILPKIGHTGTLDPMASGLMILVLGKATKYAMSLTKLDKVYEATITLGANSSTGDAEGELTRFGDRVPTLAEVQTAINQLTGEITQTPSVYSAIKIDGQEAYKRARAGETVEMPSRRVTIYSIDLIHYDYPTIDIRASVSSGTYIRTLAEDLGSLLGTGGYLTRLVRTVVGDYRLDDAFDLENATHQVVGDRLLDVKRVS